MLDNSETLFAILMIAAIVYLTRAGGYFLGLQIRHMGNLRPILESLPGCAMIAILVPAIRQGSGIELISLALVLVLMWTTNNVVISSLVGMGVLLLSRQFLSLVQ